MLDDLKTLWRKAHEHPKVAAGSLFGLAGAVLVYAVLGPSPPPPPPPRCQFMQIPTIADIIPIGTWCFQLPPGRQLPVRVVSSFDFMSDSAPGQIEVTDGRKVIQSYDTIGAKCIRFERGVGINFVSQKPTIALLKVMDGRERYPDCYFDTDLPIMRK